MRDEAVIKRIREQPLPHISRGNMKIPKNIGIFNLPAVETCPNHDLCYDTCYARKAERLYPYTRETRQRNLQLSKRFDFVLNMINMIKYFGVEKFRIHESGDFYNRPYAEKWDKIIEALPNVRFYTYSKSPYLPKQRENINIVHSILPDGSLNYGSKEYVAEKSKEFGIPICRQKVCHGCELLRKHMYVLFIKH